MYFKPYVKGPCSNFKENLHFSKIIVVSSTMMEKIAMFGETLAVQTSILGLD